MSTTGLLLFTGPDRARKRLRIQELERTLAIQPLDRHEVDGTLITGAALLALSRQRPAASPRRLIVVDQAHRLDRPTAEALLQHAARIAESACVILLCDAELAARHPFAALLAPPGPRANQPDPRRPVAVAVESFPVRDAPAVKPFALTEALGTGDTAGALAALHDQLRDGREPLELLGLVAWQLNRWVMVRRLLDEGSDAARISSMTTLKPWQVQRLEAEVTHRPLEVLQQLLQRCWRLDVDAKSGRHLPELAVEALVVEVCLAARPTSSRRAGETVKRREVKVTR